MKNNPKFLPQKWGEESPWFNTPSFIPRVSPPLHIFEERARNEARHNRGLTKLTDAPLARPSVSLAWPIQFLGSLRCKNIFKPLESCDFATVGNF